MPGPQTLTDDYFSIDEERIKQIETVLTIVNGKVETVLTIVNGKVVYANYEFQSFAPLPLKALLPGLHLYFWRIL